MDFLISGVFDDRGQDLTFEANLHLFLWDGEIVARESPHDRAQDKIEEPGVSQWQYSDTYPNTQNLADPVVENKQKRSPQPLPKISIEEVRKRIKGESRLSYYPNPSPFRPDPVRPNTSQQFEAWQQRNKTLSINRDIPNPYLDVIEFPSTDDIKIPDRAIAEGQQWIINELVGERVIGDWLTEQFGTLTYNLAVCYNEVDSSKENFSTYRLDNIKQQAKNAEEKALQEIEKYRYYGRLPIADESGILEIPTLVNIATAYVAIENLLSAIGRYRGNILGIETVILTREKTPVIPLG